MENTTSQHKFNSANRDPIKNVMTRYLHSVYYCRIYVLEYLKQAQGKIQNEELQKLIDQIDFVLKEHIELLDQFYAKLNIKPDNTYTAGIRSYIQEAIIVFMVKSKTQDEKELLFLSYLDVISAINDTQIRMLDKLATSLQIPDVSFRMFISTCKLITNDIEKIAATYLA